jgi:hypothetical protein
MSMMRFSHQEDSAEMWAIVQQELQRNILSDDFWMESAHGNPTISPPKQCWRSFRCFCEPNAQTGAQTIPQNAKSRHCKLVKSLG